MATLTISTNIAIAGTHSGTSEVSAATQRLITLAEGMDFTHGTGTNKAQKLAVGSVTGYVGTYTLDLETITQYDGSLFNPNYLKVAYFKNTIAGDSIVVGGTAMEVLVTGLGNIGVRTYDDMILRCSTDNSWDVSAGKTFLVGSGTVSFDYILVAS